MDGTAPAPNIRNVGTFAPIYQLSDDVLRHIFELHFEDSLAVDLPQFCGLASPQITLSHVCSAWREIMLDVPTFWTSIRIVPRNLDTPQTFDSAVKIANTLLSRAKGLPCSIDIDFPHNDDDTASCRWLWKRDWHENIIRDLISLHKFRKLGVTFADHHLREFLQLPDDNLLCVEDLRLRYVNFNEDDTASSLDLYKLSNLTSFSLLPQPFDFYVLSGPSKRCSKFAGIPWHNLRHIDLRPTMGVSFCLDALEHCSAVLETCSLVITDDYTLMSSPRVPVHMFQLRELKVIVFPRFKNEEILECFLLSLRFPRLKSLTLGSVDYPALLISHLRLPLRVQDVSQMQLEELIIFDATIGVDVRTLLTRFPSLRRLKLPNAVTFTDEAMTEVGAGSIGVFLEDLTINNYGLDLENLLQMVKARSHDGDRDSKHRIDVIEFKTVTLHCDKAEDEMEDEVLDFIEEIRLSGVDLKVVLTFRGLH